MVKKKGCLFGLILISLILTSITSCQFFENDVKDFMEKYTETAAVEEHKILVKTYDDVAKNPNISSFEDAEISLYMRNPKKYTMVPSVTFKDLAENINRSTVTITQNDINSLTLKLPQDFLIPSDEGKNISAEISLYEPMSGRTFEKYTVPLYCNSIPPVILNPTVINNAGSSFVIAFDMPNDEEVAIRHKDISEVVIEGVSYPVEVTTVSDAEGIPHAVYNFTDSRFTRSWNSSYIIINSKNFNQNSNSVYFETGIPFSAIDKEFTLTLKDRAGLSSTVKASTSISKLNKPVIKDQSGNVITENGTAGIPYDEETKVGRITIIPPTQDHLGNPVSGSTVYYTIYEATGSGKIYTSGTTTEEKTIELPQNTYRTEAYASLTNYENSATSSVRFRFVNNLLFVKAGSENGDGSEIAPYSSITQVLTDINSRANKDTKYTVYVEGNLQEELSITGPINTDELIIVKNPKASAAPSLKSIDVAASLPDSFKLSISNLNVNGSAGAGIKHSAAFNLPLTNVSISNATGKGLEITAGSVTYTHGTISGSGSDGISATNADLTCSDITVSGSGANGISISGGTIELENISVSDSGADGFSVSNAELTATPLTVSDSVANGISISGGTVDIDDVTVSGSGVNGISISGGTVDFDDVTVSSSGAKGISISGGTHNFNGVTVSGSTSDGINISDGELTAASLSVTGSNGCGINLAGGSLNLTNGNISQNLNGGINVAAAAGLSMKGTLNVQNNTLPASPAAQKANVILAAGKKINITGPITAGSTIGVTIAASDKPSVIGGTYSFTNGYGSYNSASPSTFFTYDSTGYGIVPHAGEGALALGGAEGSFPIIASDYTISFTASEMDGTSPLVGMYFGETNKSILISPTVTLNGETVAHTTTDGLLKIGGTSVSLSIALYNGGRKALDIPAANISDGGSGKLKVTIPSVAYKDTYTIKVLATFLGITHEANFTNFVIDHSAENAAQYISSLNTAGTYNVVVEGPVGASNTPGSEGGLAKVANAIRSLTSGTDRGVRINLDATATINSDFIEDYNDGCYFYSCRALVSIALPDWMEFLISELFLDCDGLESIELPDTVQLVMEEAFNYCSSLTEITLPATISGTGSYHGIQNNAFAHCTSLTTINFTGTTTQWKQTNRATGWHSGVPATVVHCVDGNCGLDDIPPIGTAFLSDNTHTLAVGDIVFNDGSYRSYTSGMVLSAEQQAAAIAVIFYIGDDCNNSGGTGIRRLGLGLEQPESELVLAAWGSTYHDNSLNSICTPTKDASNIYGPPFSGIKNGKNTADSLSITESDNPAFWWAMHYSEQAGTHVSGSNYEEEWYIPSIAELYYLAQQRTTLEAALSVCKGTTFTFSGDYKSSSQQAYGNSYKIGWIYKFDESKIEAIQKNISNHILAIHEF